MAKNDKSKDIENDAVNVAPQADEASAEVPVFSINLPDKPIDNSMQVDKQELLHKAASNPMQALQPGHDLVPAHDGFMGSVEVLYIKAEKEGNYALWADLQNLLAKLGEVSVNIEMIKSKYSDNQSLLNLLSSFH